MISINLEVDKAKIILENGGIVAIPTETVYGLAANAFDDNAIKKIFAAKQRPLSDPLIVHCFSLAKVKEIVSSFPPVLEKMALQCWPGPLTILLYKNNLISDLVTSGQNKVAVRIPNHPLTLSLLKNLEFPLVAPSANPFGYVSPTTAEHVKDQLADRIDYILDGGPCSIGLESTIISLDQHNNILVHRPGGLDEEKIFELTGKKPVLVKKEDSKIILPGTLEHHYAPFKTVVLGNLRENYNSYKDKKIGVLLFSSNCEFSFENCLVKKLSLNASLEEAAQNLFKCLREMDQEDIEIILVEKVPNCGIGVAINDRLMRASAKK